MLHHNGVFSKNGQWIVFDGRNDDTKIGETAEIGIVNINTGEEKIIYRTQNQTQYGPGVGAASFSPAEDRVIFIHGLPNADAAKPYAIPRRTGVAIDIAQPNQPILMDARDTTAPYVSGSLRGGTHSHCWSSDGKLISFTYNDAFSEPDLRTVGAMLQASEPIVVDQSEGNNNGQMFSAIVTKVVAHPKPDSDEINKAFDECWLKNGYSDKNDKHIPYAIAFQGNTINSKKETVSEIFIVDIDPQTILSDKSAVGTEGQRPQVPKGIQQRRITRTEKGLSSVRHWLRSDKDGKYIYALAEDDHAIAQIVRCDIRTGILDFLTKNPFSVDYSFNLNHRGDQIAFVGNNNVHVLDIDTREQIQLTQNQPTDPKVLGAPSFSPDDTLIVFNQYVENTVQIMVVKRENRNNGNAPEIM